MKIEFLHNNKMKFRNALALLILIVPVAFFVSCAKDSPDQSQKESFIKYYGDAYENIANDLVSIDGYFYMAGTVFNSQKASLLRIIKADEFGNQVWIKDFTGDYSVSGADMIVLKDKSGIAVLGTKTDAASSDFYLLKLDLNGNTLLEKVYTYEFDQTGQSLVEMSNGGFILCGTGAKSAGTSNEYRFSVTTMSNGEAMRIPEAKGNLAISINKTIALSNDTVSIGVGSIGENPMFLIFGNQQGNDPSPYPFTSINGSFADAIQVSDNEILVCGLMQSTSSHTDGFMASIDISNLEAITINWQKTYQTNYNSLLSALTLTANSSVMMTGWQVTLAGDKNIWLLKTDREGNEINQKNFGYTDNEIGKSILETTDNKYVIEGTFYYESSSLITLLKTSFE
jgi:hypothetical protein